MRGKVPYAGNGSRHSGDHPRMCGEKTWTPCKPSMMLGSPPHVRGKDAQNNPTSCPSGITPACAGKSVKWSTNRSASEDHPRMCGEKVPIDLCVGCHVGSPPHVRGKAEIESYADECDRITPACAGKRLKRSRSTVPPVAIVPLFPSVCNKPVVSDGSPAGRDAPLFLPAENAVPASPAYNLRSL